MCGDTAQYFVFFAEFDNDEPCDGAVPLVNEATGQDYNCLPSRMSVPPAATVTSRHSLPSAAN